MVRRRGRADPGEFLGDDGLGHHVRPCTPVRLGNPERRKLHLHAGGKRLPREHGIAVDFDRIGGDPLLGELAHGVAKLSLLVGQGKGRVRHPPILAELIGCTYRPAFAGSLPERQISDDGSRLVGVLRERLPMARAWPAPPPG